MPSEAKVTDLVGQARPFVDYYDVFGYYKPTLALLVLLFFIDLTYGGGLTQQAWQNVDLKSHLSPFANEGLKSFFLPLGFFLGLFLLVAVLSCVYVIGHILSAFSQFIERLYIKTLVGYPSEVNWSLWLCGGKQGFRELFYSNSYVKLITIQLLPGWIVLCALSYVLTCEAIQLTPGFWTAIGCVLLLLPVMAPKLHFRKEAKGELSKRDQKGTFALSLLIYALAFVLAYFTSARAAIYLECGAASAILAVTLFVRLRAGLRVRAGGDKTVKETRGKTPKDRPRVIQVILHVMSNHVYWLYNASKLKEPIEDSVISLVAEKYRAHNAALGYDIVTHDLKSRGVWWFAYFKVLEASPAASKAIYHFLSMSGLARALSLSFYFSALYYLFHPLLFAGHQEFHLTVFLLFLSLSYLFFYRFLYLFIKYYSNFTLRAAAYLVSAKPLYTGESKAPIPDKEPNTESV